MAIPHASDWDRDAALTTARILLEIKAVNFRPEEPYTFTSGWKSPVYIDCRKIISFPRARNRICDLAVEVGALAGAACAVGVGGVAGLGSQADRAARMALKNAMPTIFESHDCGRGYCIGTSLARPPRRVNRRLRRVSWACRGCRPRPAGSAPASSGPRGAMPAGSPRTAPA